jgi:hypothetical protein
LKITNFKLVKVQLSEYKTLENVWATVEVTTGFWRFKKTVTKTVYVECMNSFWVWADTGEFTPTFQVERLGRSFLASNYQTRYRDCPIEGVE